MPDTSGAVFILGICVSLEEETEENFYGCGGIEMAEFQEGTPDTLMERLCNSISGFDPEWVKRCVPAAEEQIQQLQDILAEYHYTIPAAYLYYLRKMGKDDGGLLERELDFCEADIDTVLDLQNEEDLEKGLFCFAYCDPFTIGFYMKLSSMDDNPSVVTDWEEKNAESFEKYLFQRAFHMYQDSFAHGDVDSDSVCHEEKDKDDCRTCPYRCRTEKERMDWVVQTAKSYNFEKAWFSDQTHFICYTLNYAFEIKVCEGYSMRFCCNDDKLLRRVMCSPLSKVFDTISKLWGCIDRKDG